MGARPAAEMLHVVQRLSCQGLDVVVVGGVIDAVAVAAGAHHPGEAEFGQVMRHCRRLHVEMLGELVDRVLAVQEGPDDPQTGLVSKELQRPNGGGDLARRRLFNYLRGHVNSLSPHWPLGPDVGDPRAEIAAVDLLEARVLGHRLE
jgi:hypothetical protein